MPGWVDKSLKVGAFCRWISMRSKIECCLATWVSCVEMLEWLLVTEGQSETGVGLTGEHAHCLISLLSRT